MVATVARARLAPQPPQPPPPAAPLPDPVRRSINREPVPEEEWEEHESSRIGMLPFPGGCLFTVGPRRGEW
jgi:hypothetical protein